ncbi:type III secretion system translocon subunit CopD2 [Chlamydia pneumoniae]|uniref:Uncharacterized protein n=2 Tax=Chlamydia pneumoniae TaxID=83558 RepID=Q9Z6P0_CHLPN|nr:type III secretion system translocon subunit CopD2 [Chlamydia pneumoniae]AAD19156.1 CT860 hypothetical protein [Chlamydia pneumoniae CWL029]AAF38627.1 conserved hypothetical protein [Chlamydia pneumoniae AR39]CRI33562.1 Uncharacterized protein BN1224_Wien1_A_10690 [Chlamydia pneumoniae]CRI36427.1 Uncharacterized protein BN1224_CM1_A_10740 [Chlamydia pneumoniae]CRI37551.1 Uncharacterized protein BN1224_CV14_A_10700 [Chlamydia pneumoniae]
MTVSYQSISTPPPEGEFDIFVDGNATEEAVVAAEVQVALPAGEQYAMLRATSELCFGILTQSECALTQALPPKEKPLQEEQFLVKNGILMRSTSLPNLKPGQSQQTSLASHRNPLAQQSTSSNSTGKASTETTSSSFPFFSCKAPEGDSSVDKTFTVSVQTPKAQEQQEASASQSQAQFHVRSYSSSTIKEHSAKEKVSQSTKSAETQKHTQTKSDATLSPMSLYSTLHKEVPQALSSTKSQQKDEEHRDQRQQEGYEQEQEQEEGKKKTPWCTVESLQQTSSSNQVYESYTPIIPDPIVEFALSESQLSVLAGKRVTNLDVLRICTELMKLMLKSRANDTMTRLEERELMEREAHELAASYSRQAKYARWLGIATATLGILGAIAPMVGEISGDSILGFVQRISGRFKDATAKTFFKGIGKVFTSLSQLTEAASKVHELSESAVRAVAEYRKEVFRMRQDEVTRTIEEVKDNWKSMDNFLLNILQTEHDAARSLYQ